MTGYREVLLDHLSSYADRELKVERRGSYRGRGYRHILDPNDWQLNLLPQYRAALTDYLQSATHLKRHDGFHHLNSSQAFALNLFFPYFSNPRASPILADALGEDGAISNLQFELVLDEDEETNIDVAWRRASPLGAYANAPTYCEVKLTEGGFGAAENDERHRWKLGTLYKPRLRDIVPDDMLSEESFFPRYQIFRNIALLHGRTDSRLIFLFPRANAALDRQLQQVLPGLAPGAAQRVRIRHIEDVIAALIWDPRADGQFTEYARALAAKYLP